MEMTNSEIAVSYRQAKNKKEQLTILAQLNLCTVDKIKTILIEEGIDYRALPRKTKGDKDVSNKGNKSAKVAETKAEKPKICDISLEEVQGYIQNLIDKRNDLESQIMEINKTLNSIEKMITPPKQFTHTPLSSIDNRTGGTYK